MGYSLPRNEEHLQKYIDILKKTPPLERLQARELFADLHGPYDPTKAAHREYLAKYTAMAQFQDWNGKSAVWVGIEPDAFDRLPPHRRKEIIIDMMERFQGHKPVKWSRYADEIRAAGLVAA